MTGGWLRAATFGAMDGLVSNTALIAGVAAAASAHTVVLSGVAGLLAGSFSMALGEYTSVTTANEQIESEVRVERRAFRKHPQAEKAELVAMLMDMGMTRETAVTATDEIHRDESRALNFHLVQELGVDPSEKPSPWVAAGSSFVMFAIGAIVPLIPYLLGFESLWAGLLCGGVGLIVAGGVGRPFHHAGRSGSARCVSWHSERSPSRRPILSEAWSIRFFSAHAPSDGAGVLRGARRLRGCGHDVDRLRRARVPGPGRGSNEVWRSTATVVGGLSGLSYDPESRLYYIISDDRSAKNPARFYTARINLSDNGIDRVEFVSTHPWLDADGRPFRPLDVGVRPPVVPLTPRASPSTGAGSGCTGPVRGSG